MIVTTLLRALGDRLRRRLPPEPEPNLHQLTDLEAWREALTAVPPPRAISVHDKAELLAAYPVATSLLRGPYVPGELGYWRGVPLRIDASQVPGTFRVTW